MNRRKFIGLVGTGIAASTSPALSIAQHRSEHPSDRPNFLFIICDDLMFRTIHSLNNPEVHTPNMDRLAASGMRLHPLLPSGIVERSGLSFPAAPC